MPERNMASLRSACYIELGWPVKGSSISVRSRQQNCYLGPSRQLLPGQCRVLGRLPQKNVAGSAETGDLLDSIADQLRLAAEQSPLLGVLKQSQHVVAEQRRRGDVASQGNSEN
jgi:hypothetical protein